MIDARPTFRRRGASAEQKRRQGETCGKWWTIRTDRGAERAGHVMRENGIGQYRLGFRIRGSNPITLILTMGAAHTDNAPRVRLVWKRFGVVGAVARAMKGLCRVGQVEA